MSRMSEYFSYGMVASLLCLPTMVSIKDFTSVGLRKLFLYPLYFRFEYLDSIEVVYGWTALIFFPSLFLGAFVYRIRHRNFESLDILGIIVLSLQQLLLNLFYINTVILGVSWIIFPLSYIGFLIFLLLKLIVDKFTHEPL